MAARFPDGVERRAAAAEVRAVAGRKLAGYAAVFGVPAQIGGPGGFTESIARGCFAASLADPGNDPVMLVDHDPSKLIGRRSSGTLRLAEDGHGLSFEADLPDTQLARDLLTMVERGDCRSCSFAFRVTDEAWPAPDRRELRAVHLVEVSAIHVAGAYAQTTIAARSRQGAPLPRWELRRRRLLAQAR
jgi:HK97 family phage prohead protease